MKTTPKETPMSQLLDQARERLLQGRAPAGQELYWSPIDELLLGNLESLFPDACPATPEGATAESVSRAVARIQGRRDVVALLWSIRRQQLQARGV